MDSPLQDRFWRCLEDSLGSDNVRAFRDAFADPASVSIRRNPAKLSKEQFLSLFNASYGEGQESGSDSVPWCNDGRYLEERPLFTLDPLLHCGAYYVQDASSMFAGTLFEQILAQCPTSRPIRVLDLCAAPGGKTTHFASILRTSGRKDCLLVSNEVMAARVNALGENVARWGEPFVAVTNSDPAEFGKLKGWFDVILVDAPCSGEGMFRKDDEAVREWSEDNVALCAARQKRILIDVWPALKSGGALIYSTCTYNRNENDANFGWLIHQMGGEIIKPEQVPDGAYVTRAGGVQFIPGKIRGEGQYVSAIRKSGGSTANSPESPKVPRTVKNGKCPSCDYVTGDFDLSLKGDLLKAVPRVLSDDIAIVEGNLKCVRSGIAVATVKGSDLIPEFDLAHCNPEMLDRSAFECVEVSRDDAVKYLKKESPAFPDKPKGYLLLTFQDVGLGFVKNLGNRANNLIPLSRRIRMQ